MGDILQVILDNLAILAPWFLITAPDTGVIFRFGKVRKTVGPGFHWRIPFVDHLKDQSSVIQFLLLPVQTVETKDNQAICFSLRIGYIIEDPIAYFTQVTDFEEGAESIVQIEAGKRVREFLYDALKDPAQSAEVDDLLKFLTRTLTAGVRDWGARVTVVGFNDWAHVQPPYRVFGIRQE